MIKVSNGRCIRRLSFKSLRASRTRNVIAVLAIALTTVLFTTLFTIGFSMNDGFQQANFRQVGGYSHGGFKYLTQEQFEALRDDTLIRQWGLRRFLGMPTAIPFNKSHVEVGYSDANQAHWMYCDPIEGRLPQENTNEAATDLHVLALLGVKPELGSEFTLTFDVDGHTTTQTFTLCGWWDYDEAIVANHVLIPESRVNAILKETGVDPNAPRDGMTGSWNLDVMLSSTLHIERDLRQILASHGFQNESRSLSAPYIRIGVNWGYTGAQLADSLDPLTVLAIACALLLIGFTGYLIIYNVFQISVTNDIRFYGLLKTIGTTPRQLRRIIREQALLLCALGIPLGLLLGWLVGAGLTPVIIARLDGIVSTVSVNPAIFAGAAAFALLTVLLSCARPGRIAARVSPVEAVRYTERSGGGKSVRRAGRSVTVFSMARSNLGRSRGKTAITVLSLSLAVVLLTLTVTFTNGFDMEKYLAKSVCTDFILADAGYFQVGTGFFGADTALPEAAIDAARAQGGITEGGRIYGQASAVQEFVTEDWFSAMYGRWLDADEMAQRMARTERTSDGRLAEDAQLFGMEDYALDRLTVLEGDLEKLRDPEGRYVAAVYSDDDYGNPVMDSHWARLGDRVTLRYVDEFEYLNPETGESYGSEAPEDEPCIARAAKYRDITYEVAALVSVPGSLSYRYYGRDEFVLGAQRFIEDTGTDSVMLYAFDTTDAANESMETFLADYTESKNPALDYESRATYQQEFESFRSMFLLLGSVLSFIVGLVGVLNFVNAILTGILSRRREFAVLQSIGMTGRQLQRMLADEGLLYALGAVGLAALLTALLSPLVSRAMESVFWFFTYRFTLAPVLVLVPVFALLGVFTPLLVYRAVAKATLVERLRDTEG